MLLELQITFQKPSTKSSPTPSLPSSPPSPKSIVASSTSSLIWTSVRTAGGHATGSLIWTSVRTAASHATGWAASLAGSTSTGYRAQQSKTSPEMHDIFPGEALSAAVRARQMLPWSCRQTALPRSRQLEVLPGVANPLRIGCIPGPKQMKDIDSMRQSTNTLRYARTSSSSSATCPPSPSS